MPLTSQNNGPELKPGDFVKMEWVVTRLFPTLGVVNLRPKQVAPLGVNARSPQTINIRVGTTQTAIKVIPNGSPLREGARCLIILRVASVYAATGSALVYGDGLGGPLTKPSPITFFAGALCSDLEFVPPDEVVQRDVRDDRIAQLAVGPGEPIPDLTEDVLPYVYNAFAYDWPPEGWSSPVATPSAARTRHREARA